MDFMTAVQTCLNNYVSFAPRARRSEYWWFGLFFLLAELVGGIVDAVVGLNGIVTGLVVVGLLLPSLAVLVRRLHDLDRSGWWYWIVLVPLVGPILLLVWCCSRGTLGPNRFGPDPITA
jgi:uncharacterized membrane protein YhaH (DUF805 family)